MYLTLYKRCILSKDYTEVFDCTDRVQSNTHYSFFTQYLETLTKTEYEIENVFITNEGSFNVPLEIDNQDNIYEYNYMKLSYFNANEQLYKTTRYCFIDNIEIRNDIATIYYTTDIWHSFSAFMELRRSYLSRSRIIDLLTIGNIHLTFSPYNLPVEYDGNNNISFDYYFDGKTNNQYNIVCEIQLYKATSGGQVSKRNSFYVILKLKTEDRYYFSKEEVINYLQTMEFNMADDQGARTYVFNEWYQDAYVNYQFDNIYVLPREFNIESLVEPNQTNALIEININKPSQLTQNYNLLGYKLINTDEYELKSLSILGDDFKLLSIGTYTKQYPIVINGTSFDIKLKLHIDNFNLNLYLDFQNQKIEITEDYRIIIPFNSILGEENAQRGIERYLKNMSGIYSAIESSIGIGSGGSLFGIGKSITETKKKYNYSSINKNKLTSTRETRETQRQEGNLGSGLLSSVIDLANANAPVYSSNKGTFLTSQGLINSYYGLVIYKINPDNENYVNKMISETGYITYYIGQHNYLRLSLSTINTLSNKPYNVVKCDFIDLYGDFPQNIVENLKDILLNGTKIWYSSNPVQY